MKILVIAKWMVRWNGASRVVYELSRRFQIEHDVKIAAYMDYIDPEWKKGFDIYPLKHKGLLALSEIRRVVKEFKPDIIHSHDWIGLLTLPSSIPQVATTHSHWPMSWFFSPTDFIAGIIQGIPNEIKLHLADRVVSVSRYGQEVLQNRWIESEVIYNGVDADFFTPTEKIPLNHPAVLFVGTISLSKAGLLTELIELLHQQLPSVHVYVIGDPINSGIVQRLKKLPNTHCLGAIKNVKSYYYESDILLFPSRVEMFGLVPAEAQACGLPIVAFNVCSLPEVVKNGETGLLVEEGDLHGIVEGVVKILRDHDLRGKMRRNGIEHTKL
ncbi:MAG: glycosyltransferase family 4 protein, partial [Chloroflexota bacterium]|nr:glycosyltransferase family 4 protein [Chloroflexota bacterium]